MSVRKLLSILLVTCLLVACAGPTPYRPMLDGTGYIHKKLDNDRYQISYTANSLTSKDKIKQYLLYHAAEITLDLKHKSFVVFQQDPGKGVLAGVKLGDEAQKHPSAFEHHHLWFDGRLLYDEYSTTTYQPYSLYTATMTIVMLDGDILPEGEGKVFNAQELIRTLGRRIFDKR